MPKEPGANDKNRRYWRRLQDELGWPAGRTRPWLWRGRLVIPLVAVGAVAIAAALPVISTRFEHVEALCWPPRDIPWSLQSVETWCRAARGGRLGDAYEAVARLQMSFGDIKRTLELSERAAELGNVPAHVTIGFITLQGMGGTTRNRERALAAFETAYRLGDSGSADHLKWIYDGQLGQGPRMPAKAVMWAHAQPLRTGEGFDRARDYGRKLGLSEAEIDAAREEMRRWLAANKMIAR